MLNTWEPAQFTVDTLQNYIENKKITIPPYQRGIVWDDNKKSSLITTIKKGFPFGSILIYEDSMGKMQLIDGLQRCSTIFEFVNKPSHFFNEQDIDNAVITKIFDLTELSAAPSVRDSVCERIKELLIRWVKDEHPTMQKVKQMQYYEFAFKLSNEFPTLKESSVKLKQIVDLIQPMLAKYIEICDFILTTKIPVIKLSGSDEELPEIFERINSNGASLTKYQIFNATWSCIKIKITDSNLLDILNYVCNRYDKMVEGYYEIENYNSTELKSGRTLNVFDLCFGFGKKLCKDFPYLFGVSTDDTKVESVGFSLINACLCYKSTEINKLHRHLREFGTDERVNNLLLKILECVEQVDTLLRVVTTFKGNKRSIKNIVVNHTEMQIISIIAFVFIQKYAYLIKDEDTDEIIERKFDLTKESTFWRTNKSIYKNNCLKIYIMDCLNEKWRGSGDKKLNSIIASNSYYLREISWTDFERSLDSWNQSIVEERNEEQKIANPKECEKILLNLIYANVIKAADHLGGDNYDIEHLATKALMRTKLEKINKGKQDRDRLKLPISAFGNLCYLIDIDNRSKGKKTLYQDTSYLRKNNLSNIEKNLSFTTKEDLDWIDIDDWDANSFKQLYLEFINKRYNIMKQKIKEALFE